MARRLAYASPNEKLDALAIAMSVVQQQVAILGLLELDRRGQMTHMNDALRQKLVDRLADFAGRCPMSQTRIKMN